MKWYEGTIPEAIVAARSRKAIFVVYIHDSSEASKTTDETLAHKDICGALGSENFVAIQLENGTEGAKQFSQIYPLVLVPSLFFISGQTGIPLEVLGGPLVVENLQQKLHKLVPSLKQEATIISASDDGRPSTSNCESSQLNDSHSLKEQQQDEHQLAAENLQTHSSQPTEPELLSVSKGEATVEVDESVKTQENDQLPEDSDTAGLKNDEMSQEQDLEERVERAKILLAHKKTQEKAEEATISSASDVGRPSTSNCETSQVDEAVKLQENDQLPEDSATAGLGNDEMSQEQDSEESVERTTLLKKEKQAKIFQEKAEEEKQKEIVRRKMGQEITKLRQQQQHAELEAKLRDLKKDTEERKKIRAQIAADRVEQEARAAFISGEQPSTSQESASVSNDGPAASPTTSDNSISRLKFRVPNGSSTIAKFPAETTLTEVRQHIQQNIQLPFSSFNLASTVHHRPFTAEEYNSTLRDLGLVPSAIIFILSASSGDSGSVIPSFSGIWDLLWILLSPITFLLRLVRQFIDGGNEPRTPPPSPDEPEVKRPREDGSSSRQRPTTAYRRRGNMRIQREGNTHRLVNNDDDDDENDTWNGNSTKQM